MHAKRIIPEIMEAKKRGVLFDVGHGRGSFSWKTAEVAAEAGFWPDTISTDLHIQNWDGPAYDLPMVMSKLYHLGMPLREVIAAVSMTPAKVLRQEGSLGCLQEGSPADITVLKINQGPKTIEDCEGIVRELNHWFEPVAVWKNGLSIPIKNFKILVPNPERLEELKLEKKKLLTPA